MVKRRQKSEYLIHSIANALDVLESFSPEERELGVTELSNRLGLHKNNVFRILATLELRGYIEQNKATGDYRLGLKTFELGQTFMRSTNLVQQARPVLHDLVKQCDETAYVGVLRGINVVYLDVVETSQSVRVASRLGAVIPACCTAIGKAILASMPREEVASRFSQRKMPVYTNRSITSREAFFRELDQVAVEGYALDNEEYEDGVRCVGVPVRDHTQSVIAGLSISGPAYRLTDERLRKELAPLIKKAGLELSKRLGYEIGVKLEGVKV